MNILQSSHLCFDLLHCMFSVLIKPHYNSYVFITKQKLIIWIARYRGAFRGKSDQAHMAFIFWFVRYHNILKMRIQLYLNLRMKIFWSSIFRRIRWVVKINIKHILLKSSLIWCAIYFGINSATLYSYLFDTEQKLVFWMLVCPLLIKITSCSIFLSCLKVYYRAKPLFTGIIWI